MTAYAFRTRRMVLRDMGKAGLAIMVLGSAACSSNEGGNESTPTSGADDTTTSSASETTTSTDAGTSAPQASAGWERANLGFVSAYILYRNGEAALVDTGVSGSAQGIESALQVAGLGWSAVGHVIVTHRHDDHQGSLEAVLAATGEAPWYAGAADLDSIRAPSGGNPVGDGDRVFDLEIIESPGHTLGHICALDSAGGVLVAGDALFGDDSGGVEGSLPQFTTDMEMANASVGKLASFDYETVLFGHGEPILASGSQAVTDLAASL